MKVWDVCVALSYLESKSADDPLSYSTFVTIVDGRLKSLFWLDGCSKVDYECFSHALAFDTTYKKTKYNNPLVIFSGCNHHSQITIFGASLLANETTNMYKWVLWTFLKTMNKQPKSIVTDGDGAMREAIKEVFPNAIHHLCGWHLSKNVFENVKKKWICRWFQ